jgi:hypothetical protein
MQTENRGAVRQSLISIVRSFDHEPIMAVNCG